MGTCCTKHKRGEHRARWTDKVARADEQTRGPRDIVDSDGEGSTDTAARADEQVHGPRDIVDSDVDGSTDTAARADDQAHGPVYIADSDVDISPDTVARTDEQTHGSRDIVDRDEEGSTDTVARADEQAHKQRDSVDSDVDSSSDTVARADEEAHGPVNIVDSDVGMSSDTVAGADEQAHGSRDIVDSDRGGSTERNFEETDTSLAALDKVYTVLVDCMVPDPVLDSLLELGFHQRLIRDIREERLTSDKNRKLIEAVQHGGNEAYAKFKSSLMHCGQERICSLLERAEKGENTSDLQRELLEIARRHEEHDKLCKVLKEDLVTYYRQNESMIPAAPLVDEHKVPIEELYVLPPMWAYDKPLSFELDKNTQKGEQTPGKAQEKKKTSFSQLFLSGKNVRYRKIYITADAGFGKTSLSQKLTTTWCQAHSPLTSLTENYDNEQLIAMKYFDYMFLIHLRDYQSEPLCNLDDLIMHMLFNNLPRNLYTNEFLQRLLHEKTCLMILDGLDEWAHPDKCRRTPSVPHNNHPDSCTVLTTSRPWKLGTIGLSEHNIDRHIEISQLDRRTRNKLEANAVRILSERNLNRAGKNIADFDEAVESVEIGDIIYNPYILLQLMCVFFGGLTIGNSKCEIYSNITEFSLERGLKKPDLPDIQVHTNDNAQVPNCINENETCKRYFILLMKLGKLAFYTLFSENKQSSLIFDRRTVIQYMTEQEIEFCLKVGLLCQTMDRRIISVKRYHVFFQHKSVHEFFSAIYITSDWQNESVKSNILNVSSSLSGILEMSNVFVFVCGINPEVYTCISGELQTIVDLDDVTRRYRTYMYSDNDAMRPMLSYQSMQVQCLQESVRNGNDSCSIHLHDYILTEEDLTSLKIIINFNKGNVKSLQLSDPDQITKFMQSLDPGVFTSLETLRVEGKEQVWLADILTESARTLKCLTLSSGLGISLSAISITALTGLTCLQSLYLLNVHMTHSNLKCLYAYISQTTTLTQLKLELIDCSDHRRQYRDCDVTLDLHLNELKMLHLYEVSCRELHVNPACLEKLEFRSLGEKMTARATLWQDLRAAPVLSSLTLWRMTSCQEMIQTIPTLTQLQHLKLRDIDMGDVIPRVSPEMTHLERVELQEVTMSSAAWQSLFFSIGQLPRSITVKLWFITMTSQEWRELLLSVGGLQHPVTVELSYCKGPSQEDWRTIVNVIKTTPTLSLLQDLRVWLGASLTLKNKTV